jgi:hypothetical protein
MAAWRFRLLFVTHETRGERYNPVGAVSRAAQNQFFPGYYVSDAALENLKPEARPSAWLVDRLDLLPAPERKQLEQSAPVFDFEDRAGAPSPVRFGGGATGFGFVDQHGRVIVVVTRDDWKPDETGLVTVPLQGVENGDHTASSLLDPEEKIPFRISSNRGRFSLPLDPWETKVFVLSICPERSP